MPWLSRSERKKRKIFKQNGMSQYQFDDLQEFRENRMKGIMYDSYMMPYYENLQKNWEKANLAWLRYVFGDGVGRGTCGNTDGHPHVFGEHLECEHNYFYNCPKEGCVNEER